MNESLLQEFDKKLAKMEAEHCATIVLWLDDAKQWVRAIRTARAENAALRAKLDAVPVYVAGVVGAAPLVSFEDFYTFVTGIGTDTDTAAGIVIPDDGGDE